MPEPEAEVPPAGALAAETAEVPPVGAATPPVAVALPAVQLRPVSEVFCARINGTSEEIDAEVGE